MTPYEGDDMTDVTLADLWVRRFHDALGWTTDELHQASRADILAVVKQMGGEEVEALQTNMGINPIDRPWVSKPGCYLIVPIEEEL
jgi:hypothetical protein